MGSRQWCGRTNGSAVRHGAYVSAAASGEDSMPRGRHELTVRAVLKQSKTELVASHSSAMPFYAGPTWGLPLDSVHGTRIDGKCGRREAGVQQHCGRIEDGDVVVRRGVKVMSACRTALEVTTVAPTEAALVAVNHLLHAGHTHRRGHGAALPTRLRVLEGDVGDGRRAADSLTLQIESVGESRFFYFCYAAGLPAPIPQYEVQDGRGQFVARVDFAWPELGRLRRVRWQGRSTRLSSSPGSQPRMW